MHLYSPVFSANHFIPFKYTCDGDNLSPPLTWEDSPKEAKSFALIVTDRDAPGGTFTHWIIYDLPGNVRQLPEGIDHQDMRSDGSKQGKNDFGELGFGGPCPPDGIHRYFFKLYALDQLLELPPGADKETVLAAMEGHTLSAAELMGRYGRANF